MATPRRPLGPVSGNSIRKKELTPYKRGQIVGAAQLGASNVEIAVTLNTPESTVRSTLRADIQRLNGESIRRSGRPKTWNDYYVRRLVRLVRAQPKLTYTQVRKELGWTYSDSTLKRMLEPSGIRNWRAKRRPHLTEIHAQKRYDWCKARLNWTLAEWRQYMWSDECSAERGKGKTGEWCFRTAAEKWEPRMVQTYSKSRDISVMVWACFWFIEGQIRRSELYLLDRDFEAKKHGYSARSYLQVLDDQMPRCWEPGLIFMQDNAPIHMARAVQDWFIEMGIPLTDWPPFSPDLNPIEHIWHHLKKLVLNTHPELEGMGKGEEAIQALEQALIEAWNALPDSLFEQVADSMPYRVAAVVKAKGWHTKY